MGRQHLPNVAKNPKFRIRALCDLNEELLAERKKSYGPEYTTTDYRTLLNDREIEAIFIGVRGDRHAEFIEKVAESGKHVFVEKPMTHASEEAERVVKAVRRSGVKLMVGFNRRFAPCMVDAKALYQAMKTTRAILNYRIMDDHNYRPKYIFDLKVGHGHLLAEGCHIFDLICWFLDEKPVRIYCQGALETDNVAVVTFEKGSIATISCGGLGSFYYPKEYMEVFSGYKTLVMDQFSELRYYTLEEGQHRHYPLKVDELRNVASDKIGIAAQYEKLRESSRRKLGPGTTQPDKGHMAEIDAFADAILNDTPSPVDEIAGARATVLALKGYESLKKKIPVEISEKDYFV